jgi:hypothetical protein
VCFDDKTQELAMIQPIRRWQACYKPAQAQGRTIDRILEVEAWNEDGDALVVDEDSGRLVPARALDGFYGLVEDRDPNVAAVPGQGWSVQYANDDGSVISMPVIAFAFEGGDWSVIMAGDLGEIGTQRDVGFSDVTLTPPAGWPVVNNSQTSVTAE